MEASSDPGRYQTPKVSPKHGYALEVEGLLFDGDSETSAGYVDYMGEKVPAAELVQLLLAEHDPQRLDLTSLEQHAASLEVKTPICETTEEAARLIIHHRDRINVILSQVGLDTRLRYQSVIQTPFDFIPATRDESHRAHYLKNKWGKDFPEMLLRLALCSVQVNFSAKGWQSLGMQAQLELGMRIMNDLRQDDTLKQAVSDSFTGMQNDGRETRQKMLRQLMLHAKRADFEAAGIPVEHALNPPHFETIDQYKKWIMAHTGVQRFEDAKLKDSHSGLVTLKGRLDHEADVIHNMHVESRANDSGSVDVNGNYRPMTVNDLVAIATPWQTAFLRYS